MHARPNLDSRYPARVPGLCGFSTLRIPVAALALCSSLACNATSEPRTEPRAEPAMRATPPPPAPATPLDLATLRNTPPPGWVDLAESMPGAVLDIRYHTPDNFTGAPLPGYGVPGAWLRAVPAQALRAVHEALATRGLGLKIYDAYRPLRASEAMVAWAERTDRVDLLDDGYVARRSGHNRGNTVDVSIVVRATGAELDFGTPWDTLSEASHTAAASGSALRNRMLLVTVMREQGFVNYPKEWWHFTYVEPGEPELPHRDVPYACFEPNEGEPPSPSALVQPRPC